MKDILSFADLRHASEHEEFCVYESIAILPATSRGGVKLNFTFGPPPSTASQLKRLIYVGGQLNN